MEKSGRYEYGKTTDKNVISIDVNKFLTILSYVFAPGEMNAIVEAIEVSEEVKNK